MALLPLMGKKLNELTLVDLQAVRQVLDIKVEINDELKTAALALMQGQDINSVADLIRSPAAIEQLTRFFAGGVTSLVSAKPRPFVETFDEDVVTDLSAVKRQAVVECPHCGFVSLHTFDVLPSRRKVPSAPKSAVVDCAHCKFSFTKEIPT